MFTYINSFVAILVCVGVLSSCHKDLGNYNYEAINEPTIAIDSSYAGTYGKSFQIVPKISLTHDAETNTYDTAKYSYEWLAINPAALVASQRYLLAKTRDLNVTLSAPPATYTVYYRMTDKQTGVQWQKTFKLTISTSIYEGWLLLSDVNNTSRLDMISLINNQYTPIPGVLDSVSSGLPAQGKPYCVAFSPYSPSVTGIYICTETGTNRVNQEDFKWDPTLNIKYEMLSKVPPGFTANFITSVGGGSQYMCAGTDFYYYYRTFSIYFGIPINIMKGENNTFKAAPFIAINRVYGAIIYDNDGKRFVKQASGETTCTPMPNDNTYFDYNTGKKLVYMQMSPFANGEVFAVLQDEGTGKFYLARFYFGSTINQTYYAEIPVADIAEAKSFAVSPDFGYLFYSIGGKIYEYDMGSKQSKLMIDKGAKEITVMKFHHFLSSKYILGTAGAQVLYNKLVVGSYDASLPVGTGGTMELYSVPPINGDLKLEQSYAGFGKIASISYRER